MNEAFTHNKLRLIARYHRAQLFSILLLLIGVVGLGMVGLGMITDTPGSVPPVKGMVLISNIVYFLLIGMVGVFSGLLAWQMYTPLIVVLVLVGSAIPGVNLVIWLVLNILATTSLRKAGVTVGFLGARSKTLPAI